MRSISDRISCTICETSTSIRAGVVNALRKPEKAAIMPTVHSPLMQSQTLPMKISVSVTVETIEGIMPT